MTGVGTQGSSGPTHESRVAQLEQTLRIGQAGIMVLLAGVAAALGSFAAPGAHGWVAAVLALVGVDVLVTGPRLVQVVITTALTIVTATPPFVTPGDSTCGIVASAATVCLVRALPGEVRRHVVVLGALLTSYVVIRLVSTPEGILASLDLIVAGPIVAYTAGLLAGYLERGTARADAAAAAADAKKLALTQHDAADHAVRQARRVLHDEILTALSAVATSSDAEPSRDAISAKALSRRATAAMQQLAGASLNDVAESCLGNLDQTLAEVVARAPVAVDLHVDPGARTRALTPEAYDAARRALAEALRNVARHTTCTEATLDVAGSSDGVVLTVRDDGGGLANDDGPGVGTAEAIHGAVLSVGGRASITHDLRGCRVELELPAERTDQHEGALQRARAQTEAAGGPIGGLVWLVATPLFALQAYLGVKYSFRYDHPALSLALLVVAASIAVAYVTTIVKGAPPDRVELAFHVSFLAMGLVSLAMTPPGGLLDPTSWTLGLVGNLLFIGGFLLPLRWALGMLAVNTVVLLVAWRLDPALSDGLVPIGSLNAMVFTPLVAVVLGAMVRRDGRVVIEERAERLHTLAEIERRRQLSRAVSLHLDHTRRVIVPWLHAVAAGELDVADPRVRAHARVLAREARDDLHAAGFFDDGLRARVSRYRADGGTVDIRPGLRPGSHARTTGAVLHALVTQLPPRHRITVSPTPQAPEQARVVVVPPCWPLPAFIPRGAHLLEHDDDCLVLTVTDGDGGGGRG